VRTRLHHPPFFGAAGSAWVMTTSVGSRGGAGSIASIGAAG
jgi:hypothetical protein